MFFFFNILWDRSLFYWFIYNIRKKKKINCLAREQLKSSGSLKQNNYSYLNVIDFLKIVLWGNLKRETDRLYLKNFIPLWWVFNKWFVLPHDLLLLLILSNFSPDQGLYISSSLCRSGWVHISAAWQATKVSGACKVWYTC